MKWIPREVPVCSTSVYTDYVLCTDGGRPLPAVVEEWSPHGVNGSLIRNNRTEHAPAGVPRWLPKVSGSVVSVLAKSPCYPMNIPTDLHAAQRMAEEELELHWKNYL